ncbi:uncharacterized protein N7482_008349 [Penicillium canariense]|uniref:Uncharacterized protein n=1 Tax=Penicillium canariense TaxID=189055 RepID=A0A9W9HY96_9EURO|nr:uncharacterized protein N7482_008349 [Penicillium canariense]KAJ5157249.1 hypothetical protein N7482_008349 [Penicillium canariense]
MREDSARHFGRDATGLDDRSWVGNASSGAQALNTATSELRTNGSKERNVDKKPRLRNGSFTKGGEWLGGG